MREFFPTLTGLQQREYLKHGRFWVKQKQNSSPEFAALLEQLRCRAAVPAPPPLLAPPPPRRPPMAVPPPSPLRRLLEPGFIPKSNLAPFGLSPFTSTACEQAKPATAESLFLQLVEELRSARAAAVSQPPATASRKRTESEEQQPEMPAAVRIKLEPEIEEQPPPMPPDARVKLEVVCESHGG